MQVKFSKGIDYIKSSFYTKFSAFLHKIGVIKSTTMSKFEKEQVYKYPKVLICGYGIVGKHLKIEFPFAETYDPDKDMGADFTEPPAKEYEITFVSVPTPNAGDGHCDTRFVKEALEAVKSDIYVLKSTVPPETTATLAKEMGKHIIFSPEFYGNTPQSNASKGFVILGGERDDRHKVRQLYEYVHTGDFVFNEITSTEAEIVKYMENCFLGLKVIFFNQFKDIADLYKADYDRIRDALILDTRIGTSHTFVFDNYRGYDSKCLNKDIPAIISAVKDKGYTTPQLMERVEEINRSYRK